MIPKSICRGLLLLQRMWNKVVKNDLMCLFSICHHVSNCSNALVLFIKLDMNNSFSFGLTLGCMATKTGFGWSKTSTTKTFSIFTISTTKVFWLLKVWWRIPIHFVMSEINFDCLIDNGSIYTVDLTTKFGPFFGWHLGNFILIVDNRSWVSIDN